MSVRLFIVAGERGVEKLELALEGASARLQEREERRIFHILRPTVVRGERRDVALAQAGMERDGRVDQLPPYVAGLGDLPLEVVHPEGEVVDARAYLLEVLPVGDLILDRLDQLNAGAADLC